MPFDEMTELKACTNMGKRQIIVISRGPDFIFGWNLIASRKIEAFAQRLEEAVIRRRFYAGCDPINIRPERSRKGKKKEEG